MTETATSQFVCKICSSKLEQKTNTIAGSVNCPCCGHYKLTATAAQVLTNSKLDEFRGTAIAYTLRRASERDIVQVIDSDFIRRNRYAATLPSLDEIVDQAVLWVGSNTRYPGHTLELTYPEYKGVLGAIDEDAFNEILKSLIESGWFAGEFTSVIADKTITLHECRLSQAGMHRFRELTAAQVKSRFAFMAMKYGDSELDALVLDHFSPAVARTGFELRRLDQNQPAGLIDDQLRVQIRTSRFLICDLTHGNYGAYWEAGFAEGLGRPVIYTCREDVFSDPTHPNRPHFDTNHFVTVLWNSQSPEDAAKRLVTTIRATLPLEALLQDSPSSDMA